MAIMKPLNIATRSRRSCAKGHSTAAIVYTAQLSEMESQKTALCGKLPVVVKNAWHNTSFMQ